jgi:hypothetical protein
LALPEDTCNGGDRPVIEVTGSQIRQFRRLWPFF